jgi:hypothetical protein
MDALAIAAAAVASAIPGVPKSHASAIPSATLTPKASTATRTGVRVSCTA